MKNIVFIAVLVSGTVLFSCSSSNSKDTFYVRGNCEMCKERIETTALSIKGVSTADWNVETKDLSITFDSTQTSSSKVHEAVANVGHGTKLVPMNTVAHEQLHECCKVRE